MTPSPPPQTAVEPSPPPQRRPRAPCHHYKHLKCDFDSDECRQCRKGGLVCTRGRPGIRFRPGCRARYDLRFTDDQVWLKNTRRSSRLRFVDETADISAGYTLDWAGSDLDGSDEDAYASSSGERLPSSNRQDPNHSTIPTYPTLEILTRDQSSAPALANHLDSTAHDAQQQPTDRHKLPVENPFLQGPFRQPMTCSNFDAKARLKAILIRYFVEEVAHRFDICDPERHFMQVVPQRALSSPPLLNAILTTAARHLTRLSRHQNAAGQIEWQGHLLTDLTESSAVYYHNECIQGLLRLSSDPEQIHNENLLAAAIILRTDEEMDAPIRDEEGDTEVFLGMLNMFITAQVPSMATLPHSSPQIHASQNFLPPTASMSSTAATFDPPPSTFYASVPRPTPPLPAADGLRQATFWVALRQELFTSYMKQRPLHFPLSYCESFRSFTPAEDAVWADRLIIFCADVLEYCYGTSKKPESHHQEATRGWHELKRYEEGLTQALPKSFQPIYYQPPEPQSGHIFPQIWHLSSYHVTGTNHADLARILLAVFDPTRPKLGLGYVASQRELTQQLRTIVLRLGGIALSNRRSPPAFIEALMGINTCGGYFQDRNEQAALLEILKIGSCEHAFPTGKIEIMLKQAWGWV